MVKKLIKVLLLIGLLIISIQCENNSSSNEKYKANNSHSGSNYKKEGERKIDEFNYYKSDLDEKEKEEGEIEDGIYSATVEYYNPNTNYSATYTLEVEIENREVTVIYFPNDGYLDDDHIYPTELDEDGYAEVEGEEGKTYEVQIDL